jgi:hypothetical protein
LPVKQGKLFIFGCKWAFCDSMALGFCFVLVGWFLLGQSSLWESSVCVCVCVSLSLSASLIPKSLVTFVDQGQQIRVLVFFLGWWWLTWYPILWWLKRRMPNWDVSICHLFCLQQRWRVVDCFLFNFSFIHIFGEEMVGWSAGWFLSSQRLQIAMILLLWACSSECVTAWSNWVQFLFETHECKQKKFPFSTLQY